MFSETADLPGPYRQTVFRFINRNLGPFEERDRILATGLEVGPETKI
jgi:hypothetical protein